MRFNLRLSLDDVISDDEQKILENIKYCSRLVGKSFKVVFWNREVSESEIKDFIKRNEEVLFNLNTKITKKTFPEHAWFLINSNGDKCKAHYSFSGSVINGIASYIKIVKHLKRIENENKS
tara:strand:- start:292 stop:654 length:363 start_codon:yes stop_codon:yes gene_type:complete